MSPISRAHVPGYVLDWLIEWSIDWLSDRSIDRLIDWVSEWVIDWLIDWLIDWVSEWSIDWLIGWLIVCFADNIHFFTSAWILSDSFCFVFYNLRFDDVFHSGRENSYSGFLFWPPFLLEAIRAVFCPACFSHFLSSRVLRSTNHFSSFSNRLFRAIAFLLSSHWLPFVPRTSSRPSPAAMFCFAPRFPLSSDWLPYVHALVPGLLQRLCFVLRRDFLCRPTDCLLFRALVPGLLQRLCFVLRRGFLCLPTDFLTFTH